MKAEILTSCYLFPIFLLCEPSPSSQSSLWLATCGKCLGFSQFCGACTSPSGQRWPRLLELKLLAGRFSGNWAWPSSAEGCDEGPSVPRKKVAPSLLSSHYRSVPYSVPYGASRTALVQPLPACYTLFAAFYSRQQHALTNCRTKKSLNKTPTLGTSPHPQLITHPLSGADPPSTHTVTSTCRLVPVTQWSFDRITGREIPVDHSYALINYNFSLCGGNFQDLCDSHTQKGKQLIFCPAFSNCLEVKKCSTDNIFQH